MCNSQGRSTFNAASICKAWALNKYIYIYEYDDINVHMVKTNKGSHFKIVKIVSDESRCGFEIFSNDSRVNSKCFGTTLESFQYGSYLKMLHLCTATTFDERHNIVNRTRPCSCNPVTVSGVPLSNSIHANDLALSCTHAMCERNRNLVLAERIYHSCHNRLIS